MATAVVTGKVTKPSNATGMVMFTPTAWAGWPVDGVVQGPSPVTAAVAANGSFTATLWRTDDAVSPDWVYRVVFAVPSVSAEPFYIRVDGPGDISTMIVSGTQPSWSPGSPPWSVPDGRYALLGHDHDARYYTQQTVNQMLATLTSGGTVTLEEFWKGGTSLSSSTDLEGLPSGAYSISATETATALGMPTANFGVLLNLKFGVSGARLWLPVHAAGTVWHQIRAASVWYPWKPIGGTPRGLGSADDWNTLRESGLFVQAAIPTDWAAQNMPGNLRGVLEVISMSSSAVVQRFTSWENVPRVFARRYYNGVWYAWAEIGAAPDAPDPVVLPPSPAGWKIADVPLTAGHSGSDAPLTGGVRIPLDPYIPPPIRTTRVRFRLRNINSRNGIQRAGQITLSGVWLADIDTTGTVTSSVQVSGPITFDGAAGWVSGWVGVPGASLAGKALVYGYSADSPPWDMMTTAWLTSGDPLTGPVTHSKLAAFSVDVIAEVPATTPIIAVHGDSNSVGVGTSRGLRDSWPTKLGESLGAIVQHMGASGTSITQQETNINTYPWTRNALGAKPDIVLTALGQNDVAVTGADPAAIATAWAAYVGELRTQICDAVYAVSLIPRSTDPHPEFETVRHQVNIAMSGARVPGLVRDYLSIVSAVSTDDVTLTAAAVAADGVHLSSNGTSLVANALKQHLLLPGQLEVA